MVKYDTFIAHYIEMVNNENLSEVDCAWVALMDLRPEFCIWIMDYHGYMDPTWGNVKLSDFLKFLSDHWRDI